MLHFVSVVPLHQTFVFPGSLCAVALVFCPCVLLQNMERCRQDAGDTIPQRIGPYYSSLGNIRAIGVFVEALVPRACKESTGGWHNRLHTIQPSRRSGIAHCGAGAHMSGECARPGCGRQRPATAYELSRLLREACFGGTPKPRTRDGRAPRNAPRRGFSES